MDKQLKVNIARKSNNYFLTLNGKEVSEGFSNKLGGFQIILKKFFKKELSFQNFKNLFNAISSNNQTNPIPAASLFACKNIEDSDEEIATQVVILHLTIDLFESISFLIFLIENAQSDVPTPRVVHNEAHTYIQLEKIPDITNTFTANKSNFADFIEIGNDQINHEINSIYINFGTSSFFRSKIEGVTLVKELYLFEKITQAEGNKLLQEISILDIPNVLLDESKKKYN